MKTFNLNPKSASTFAGILRKMIKTNGSFVFPSIGTHRTSNHFGNIRKISSNDPHCLTTIAAYVEIKENCIWITNPYNKTFGYAELGIPFGKVYQAYNSFFWRDKYNFWRQMKFSKHPGYALLVSGDIKFTSEDVKNNPSPEVLLKESEYFSDWLDKEYGWLDKEIEMEEKDWLDNETEEEFDCLLNNEIEMDEEDWWDEKN